MCAPALMDSTQSRLHWNRLRRSFREWKAATVWGLRIGGGCPLGRRCGLVKGIPRPERNVIRVLLQPCKQHGGRGGRHVFFFHHSPCARVVAAMPGINGYTIRRVAHLRLKRLSGCRDTSLLL